VLRNRIRDVVKEQLEDVRDAWITDKDISIG
jgi:hypothetical protein